MHPPKTAIERILDLATTPGITIILDGDTESQEAKMGAPYTYEPNDKILKVTLSEFSEEDLDKLLPLIKKFFEETGLLILDNQEEVVESYSKYVDENADKKTLEFFKEVLYIEDFYALKMSLFMKSEKEKGASIDGYKKDIRERFGPRGTTIANLCNAGYFENEFMPLYNEVPIEEFERRYELAVGKKARALFIHSGMTLEILQEAFDSVISKARRFHIDDFRIHAFGWQNVDLLKKFLKERLLDDNENFNIIKRTEMTAPPAIEYDVVFF